MSNETLVNICLPPDGPLDASGDIVGPGMLVAFLASAGITIVAVIFAYLSDSLDLKLLNSVDRRTIKWSMKQFATFNAWLWSKGQPTCGNITSDHYRESRARAVTRFVLALSDQQLVTGLGISIAAISARDRLSAYEYTVAHSLALFSSTTHLATMDVLRQTFRDQKMFFYFRSVGMISVLALLTFTTIDISRTGATEGNTVPIICHPELKAPVNRIITLMIIWASYLSRFSHFHSSERDLWYWFKWPLWKLINQSGDRPSYKEFHDEFQASIRRHTLYAVLEGHKKHLLRLLSEFYFAFHLYNESFLSTFPIIALSLCYAVGQLVDYRWRRTPSMTMSSVEMGFGQFMAVFLLMLPLLSAAEARSDYKLNLSGGQSSGSLHKGTSRTEPSSPVNDNQCLDIKELFPERGTLSVSPERVTLSVSQQEIILERYNELKQHCSSQALLGIFACYFFGTTFVGIGGSNEANNDRTDAENLWAGCVVAFLFCTQLFANMEGWSMGWGLRCVQRQEDHLKGLKKIADSGLEGVDSVELHV